MPPKIRPFHPSETETLHRLVAEMQDFERLIDTRLLAGDEMAVAYTAEMRARCDREAGTILVADIDGVIAGFVAVRAAVPSEELDQPPGTYALVSDLSVDANYRGRGTGRALLAAAERYAAEQGATELRIAVLTGNVVADALYRSAGFRPYLQTMSKMLPDSAPSG